MCTAVFRGPVEDTPSLTNIAGNMHFEPRVLKQQIYSRVDLIIFLRAAKNEPERGNFLTILHFVQSRGIVTHQSWEAKVCLLLGVCHNTNFSEAFQSVQLFPCISETTMNRNQPLESVRKLSTCNTRTYVLISFVRKWRARQNSNTHSPSLSTSYLKILVVQHARHPSNKL